MENKKPKVTLLSWTKNPLELVYSVWQASKDDKKLLSVDDVIRKVKKEEVDGIFKAVMAQKIPIGEHIDFVFMIENISISWREQAVRHRIGTKPSLERLGVDIVPDLADSSWWSQSHRIRDVSYFATKGEYRMPETISRNIMAKNLFTDTMEIIQNAYKALLDLDIPMEDAREIIPLGAQHRISWKLNFSALQHILGKRACWILQLGLWGPIIKGMVKELAEKIDPLFYDLVKPPCIGDDENKPFTDCKYMEECHRRLDCKDDLPPCPLHLNYYVLGERTEEKVLAAINSPVFLSGHDVIPDWDNMKEKAEEYREFWNRNPYTGEKLDKKDKK